MIRVDGDIIRKVRIANKLTQGELGALCDVSDAYINMIERGKRSVSDRLRLKLIDELAITPEKLSQLLAEYERIEERKVRAKRKFE